MRAQAPRRCPHRGGCLAACLELPAWSCRAGPAHPLAPGRVLLLLHGAAALWRGAGTAWGKETQPLCMMPRRSAAWPGAGPCPGSPPLVVHPFIRCGAQQTNAPCRLSLGRIRPPIGSVVVPRRPCPAPSGGRSSSPRLASFCSCRRDYACRGRWAAPRRGARPPPPPPLFPRRLCVCLGRVSSCRESAPAPVAPWACRSSSRRSDGPARPGLGGSRRKLPARRRRSAGQACPYAASAGACQPHAAQRAAEWRAQH